MRNKILALCLGSNLGVPLRNLRKALAELRQSRYFKVIKVSSIYESDALLPDGATEEWQLKFLNAVVVCELIGDLAPEGILTEVKRIEGIVGRTVAAKWAPRVIDIDIIYWSEAPYRSSTVSIPHLRLTERPFALLPLLDVWPRLNISRPLWCEEWVSEKPFNTRKSSSQFWPEFVGVLNVTTDSFSDGGMFLNAETLALQVEKLQCQGAGIIEIGAESTRPQAKPVSSEQEYNNLNWALNELKGNKPSLRVSIDSRNPEVIKKILGKHRVDYLNDVGGFALPEMQQVLRESGLPAFVMHSKSVPPRPDDVLSEESSPALQLTQWWKRRLQEMNESGIPAEKLIFDPGIGFGKSPAQCLYLLRNLEDLGDITSEIMIGHSRKSYLKTFSDRGAAERDLETALITQQLNLAFVQYLRVHDIESQVVALRSR